MVSTELPIVTLSQDAAMAMARSKEVHLFHETDETFIAQVDGDLPWRNYNWGLPDVFCSVQWKVDGDEESA